MVEGVKSGTSLLLCDALVRHLVGKQRNPRVLAYPGVNLAKATHFDSIRHLLQR